MGLRGEVVVVLIFRFRLSGLNICYSDVDHIIVANTKPFTYI